MIHSLFLSKNNLQSPYHWITGGAEHFRENVVLQNQSYSSQGNKTNHSAKCAGFYYLNWFSLSTDHLIYILEIIWAIGNHSYCEAHLSYIIKG